MPTTHTVALEIEHTRDRVATMVAGGILIVGLPLFVSFTITDFNAVLVTLTVGLFISLGAGITLIRDGRGRLGRVAILGVIALTLLGDAVWFGGVASVPFVAWVMVVLLSTVVVGPRAGLGAAIVGIVAGCVLFAVQGAGLLPDAHHLNTPSIALRISSALFLVVALLAWTLTTRLEQGMHRFADAEADRALLVERYQLAGRGAQFGIWDFDRASDTVWLDPGIQQLLGEPEGVVNMSAEAFRNRIHPDDHSLGSSGSHLTDHETEFETERRGGSSDGRRRRGSLRSSTGRSSSAPWKTWPSTRASSSA